MLHPWGSCPDRAMNRGHLLPCGAARCEDRNSEAAFLGHWRLYKKELQFLNPKMLGAFCAGWITLTTPLGVAPSQQPLGAPGCRLGAWIPVLWLCGTTIQCPINPSLLSMGFHKDLRSSIVRCSHFWSYHRQRFPDISRSNAQ